MKQGLRDFYYSPDITGIIDSTRKRWVKHVTRMGVRGMHARFWWGKTEEKEAT